MKKFTQLFSLGMVLASFLAFGFRNGAFSEETNGLPTASSSPSESRLEKAWQDPPLDARTRAFWWWLNSNVTQEAITRDLEEMKDQGMGGALLFDADGSSQRGNAPVPAGPMFGTPAWQKLFFHAVEEADRLGLELGFSIQSGWNLGGPDLTPEETAKQLCWTRIEVDGGEEEKIILPRPEGHAGFYRDIVVLAYPQQVNDAERSKENPDFHLKAKSQEDFPIRQAMDGSQESYWVSPGHRPGDGPSEDDPVNIQITADRPVRISGMHLLGRKGYGPKKCRLHLSPEDGEEVALTDVISVPDGQSVEVRFEPTVGQRFRLELLEAYDNRYKNSPRNVQISEVHFLNADGRSLGPHKRIPPIEDLSLKAMFRELGGSAPDCRFLLFPRSGVSNEAEVSVEDIIRLTDCMDPDGELRWQAERGRWTILRIGYTNTRAHVSTSSGDWQGPVIDYMSKSALKNYWGRHIAPMLEQIRPHCGQSLKYVETDSWECGGMNWTKDFEEEFQRRNGYDILPWLAVVTGTVVESRNDSHAFLADFRKTIADCVADNHYALLSELAAQYDLKTQPESGGPHAGPLDGIKNLGLSGLAMSEFWRPSPHRPEPHNRFFVKQASSAAHIYGIKIVGAEGFTSIGPHWDDSLWRHLKPSFDHEACAGLNLTFLHTFTCSPKEMGIPGQEYFAGTHFNPNVTWWPMAGAFLGYLNRCQALLQEGTFVADVCYYYGDHIPNIARLKEDDPAGVLPDYDYDVLSEEILLRVEVPKNASGETLLVLPTGMAYRLLVLPDHQVLSLSAIRKVADLVQQGAVIVGPRPIKAVSKIGGEAGEREFRRLAETAWDSPGPHVIDDRSPKEVLRDLLGVPADFSAETDKELKLDWLHRSTDEGEIYFVANLAPVQIAFPASFRVVGRQPELWDPVSGKRRICRKFSQEKNRTVLPLKLPPNGSTFVVFRKRIDVGVDGKGESNYPCMKKILSVKGPWSVGFDPKAGGPGEVVFQQLIDWTEDPREGIRYYSGIATYSNSFTISPGLFEKGSRFYLDLGAVREMARVQLNGKDLGVVWAPPFQIEITDALKEGNNDLEIEVANTWRNRLVGDQKLPPEERWTRTNIRVTDDWEPLPSGLMGPLTVITISGK